MSNEYEVFVFQEYNNTGEMRAEPLTKRGGKMPRLKGMNAARSKRIWFQNVLKFIVSLLFSPFISAKTLECFSSKGDDVS